jgi:hypothetical protein|tara:strand:- start:65 stop:196 length:132 start_codon:yes stop_codon:yes gene_type:complete
LLYNDVFLAQYNLAACIRQISGAFVAPVKSFKKQYYLYSPCTI